ncbi:hypothetical protein BS50DRAFT_220054 [Corynespora cassiicola Philippines]|uniref:Zn(2)-C6 fungal-type domain-containing protein n=1 Tax=Corynespora cassiicola Philippines TaxID=1448308 RepID=A0A2T2N3L7_CORCC|nr:hypothetical protein BS50DRAFT_220054 [Corynespora cassiicola Philippines]
MDKTSTSEAKIRKRKQRAVLSCNDCRRRKLKCDRELPCNRCLQGGYPQKCAYGHGPDAITVSRGWTNLAWQDRSKPARTKEQSERDLDSAPPDQVSLTADSDRFAALEQRIRLLEGQLSSPAAFSEALQEQSDVRPSAYALNDPSPSFYGLFKGRNYRTFLYGPTCPMTIIAHFPDIRGFMRSLYTSSSMGRFKADVKALEDRARINKVSSRPLQISSLRMLLPERLTVDIVVRKYFDTFEKTYRILHAPTFWAAYESFWDSPGINPEMDAIVLAILACTLCTSNHDSTRYDPNGSTFRSKAITWLKGCEAWLKRQSNKHRTLASLQVRCLRILALMTTCYKTKEIYQETQAHMAFMRAIGMHRDPSILGARCSVFEGEIRRRLWATSLELELQTSIDRGMSPATSGFEYDCSQPRNINDVDLYTGMQQLPNSQPISVFTDTSFLHCSMSTASLRIRICALMNGLQRSLDLQDALELEQEVQQGLENIPTWLEENSLQAQTLLDLQLRQFIAILHTPRALLPQDRMRSDQRYSILTCLETSTTTIERHIALLEVGNYSLCCIRSDYYRSALLICHIAYYAATASDALVKRVAKTVFDSTMNQALRLQEERAMRPGRGSHQYWYVDSACSLVGIKFEPSRTDALRRQAVDRVSRLLYRILSLQDDPSENYLASEVMLSEDFSLSADSGVDAAQSSIVDPESFSNANAALSLDGLDFAESSEWVLDDFWFFGDLPTLL